MSSQQIAVRLPESLLSNLDRLISSGRYGSRAEAVRAGVEKVLADEERRSIDRAIIAGYQKHPQTDADALAATASLRAAIQEEPW